MTQYAKLSSVNEIKRKIVREKKNRVLSGACFMCYKIRTMSKISTAPPTLFVVTPEQWARNVAYAQRSITTTGDGIATDQVVVNPLEPPRYTLSQVISLLRGNQLHTGEHLYPTRSKKTDEGDDDDRDDDRDETARLEEIFSFALLPHIVAWLTPSAMIDTLSKLGYLAEVSDEADENELGVESSETVREKISVALSRSPTFVFDSEWGELRIPRLFRRVWIRVLLEPSEAFWRCCYVHLAERIVRPKTLLPMHLCSPSWRVQLAHYLMRETSVIRLLENSGQAETTVEPRIVFGQEDTSTGANCLQLEIWLTSATKTTRSISGGGSKEPPLALQHRVGVVQSNLARNAAFRKVFRDGVQLRIGFVCTDEVHILELSAPNLVVVEHRNLSPDAAADKLGLTSSSSSSSSLSWLVEPRVDRDVVRENVASLLPDNTIIVRMKTPTASYYDTLEKLLRLGGTNSLSRAYLIQENLQSFAASSAPLELYVSRRLANRGVFLHIMVFNGLLGALTPALWQAKKVAESGERQQHMWKSYIKSLVRLTTHRRVFACVPKQPEPFVGEIQNWNTPVLAYMPVPKQYLELRLVIDEHTGRLVEDACVVSDGGSGLIAACTQKAAQFEFHWRAPSDIRVLRLDGSTAGLQLLSDQSRTLETGGMDKSLSAALQFQDLNSFIQATTNQRTKSLQQSTVAQQERLDHHRRRHRRHDGTDDTVRTAETPLSNDALQIIAQDFAQSTAETIGGISLALNMDAPVSVLNHGSWIPDTCMALLADPYDMLRESFGLQYVVLLFSERAKPDTVLARVTFRLVQFQPDARAELVPVYGGEVLSPNVYPLIVEHYSKSSDSALAAIPLHTSVSAKLVK